MYQRADQFAKSLLREALSLVSNAETEVEVVSGSQRIDVYCVPDPERASERAKLGLLGTLSTAATLFEPYYNTPTLQHVRACVRKQHNWHHELERRARVAVGGPSSDPALEDPGVERVPFPSLVIVSPGRPVTALEGYRFEQEGPGVYESALALAMKLVVLSELPRTRETLMVRLLGKGAVLRAALEDLKALPEGAWERGVSIPLLVHFRLAFTPATPEEDDVSSEIQTFFDDFQRRLRDEGRQEGRQEGERALLLKQLRARFGALPNEDRARVEAADVSLIELWGERVLTARSIDEVFAPR